VPAKRTSRSESSASKPGATAGCDLELGRECYARRAWADAFAALSSADRAAPLATSDLELLAWSAGLTGHDDELLRAFERLYHACLARDPERAARWAFWLGYRRLLAGEIAVGSGWLARAQRLIDGEEPSVISGYLLLPVARRHFASGDYDAAHDAAAEAAAIGERFGEKDLVSFAHNALGWVLLRQGRIERGLALLDEAMLAATRGELSPTITGLVYCMAIASCQDVYALERSREWTAALAQWCDAQPQLVTFTGACRVHRAEILELGGAWPEAIEEARRVSEPRAKAPRPDAASAHYRLADIERLQGQFARAEDTYRKASELGCEPQPGLALLRLAQGRADAAAASLRRAVAATDGPIARLKLLPALVEILLAAGDIDGARTACSELEEIAKRFATPVLGAMVAHARGEVTLAMGDAEGALLPLRRAFEGWQQVGAPYVVARIRVALARACRALGDGDGAALELAAAREVFERLGAAPDVAVVDRLQANASKQAAHGLTQRELEVLRLVASGKTNKVIAAELGLSEKTVDRHVSNIFVKVDVPSRAAATAFAYEHGLI
jgi:DNA-binding CsgD family transcriptional regulator